VPVAVTAPADTGFMPAIEDIRAAITPRTKVLVINSPSNPTGAVYPAELLQGMVDLAEEHDFWIFTDDLYEHLVYDGQFVTAASLAPHRTLLVHGASKGYAMTGWRIGFGAGPSQLIRAMNRLQGQSTSNANALAQHAAVAALNEVKKTAEFQRMARAAYVERRDVLVKGLNDLGLHTPKPQGAFYVMADATPIDADEQQAAIRLLEVAHVGVVPGTDFLAPGRVRLSYATSLDNVKEAIERVGRLLG
jgi:aspartate aminotransferase